MMICLFLALGLIGLSPADDDAPPAERTRLMVLTDISSLTAGVAEPDDGQSLIRLMLYANEFDIEGLVATSNLGHGHKTRPDLIHQVVDNYEKVQPNLLSHDPRYAPAAALRKVIKAGWKTAGPKVPVESSIGEDKDTEASAWIARCVDRPDSRPLWVVIWGGSADLAQALWKARRDRTPEELDRFVAKLRVHAIGDQDSTGPWIREHFPNLFVITQQRAYRGMYRGGDPSLVSSEWVETNIHGHGPLGDLYPNYRGGDIWSGKLGPVRGIKEGDTPSFLALVPNGLFDPDHPELGSWGGRFTGEGRHLTDIPDQDIDTSADPDPRMSSVYRWRPTFQNDFVSRLDWCVKPPKETNHPPVARVVGPTARRADPEASINLDASESTDPDGDALHLQWSIYPLDPENASLATLHGGDTPKSRIEFAEQAAGKTIPILLSVTDNGTPPLTRYQRVIITVGERAQPSPRE